MIPEDELRAYQRRADAGLLRRADVERLLAALRSVGSALEEAAHELAALRARDRDSQVVIESQRSEISKLRATIGSLRRELRQGQVAAG